MKSIEELVGLYRSQGDIQGDTQDNMPKDIQDDQEENPCLAEVSYSFLRDGSLDIKFSWFNDINVANIMGELLYQIHGGLLKNQTLQELGKMGDDVKHGKFIENVLTTWAGLHNLANNTPLIRPSEVSRANMMYQQGPQE